MNPDAAAAPRRGSAAFDTLRIRGFRFLWVSNGLTLMSFQMRTMGQAWLVLELTDSTFWVGVANGLPALPIVFFSLLGGVLADRADRRLQLVYVRLALGGLAFATAFVITTGAVTVWYVVLLALAAGSTNAVGMPASQTYVFDLVGPKRLFSAVSLNAMVSNLGTIVGPSVGGVLVAALGVDAVFYLIGVAYLVASGALLLIGSEAPHAARRRATVVGDLVEGFAYVRQNRRVAWLLVLGFIVLFAAFYYSLVPVYARDVLGVGSAGYGYLLGGYGLGGLTASLALAIAGDVRRKGALIASTSAVFGLVMVVFAFSRSFPLSMACSVLGGVTAMAWINTMNTVLQTSVSEDVRGRVMSIFTLTMQVFPLGWMIAGALAEVVGKEATVAAGGLLFAGANLLAYLSSREIRRM